MNLKISDTNIKKLGSTKPGTEIYDTSLTGFCLIVRANGKHTFCIRYRNAAGATKKYTIGAFGQITTTTARNLAQRLIADTIKGIDIQAEKIKQRQQAKRDELSTLDAFIEHKYKPWLESHLQNPKEALRVLNVDFSELHSKQLSDINRWDIEKWIAHARKERGLKPSTINRRVAEIKSLMSKALEWDMIDLNPLAGMKRLKTDNNKAPRYLSPEEEQSLIKALENREARRRQERINGNHHRQLRHQAVLVDFKTVAYSDYLMPMVITALNTGMRRGELFKLQWRQVDLKNKIINIEGNKAKSQQSRQINMNKAVFGALVAWANQSNNAPTHLVFPSSVTGKKLDNIYKSWNKLMVEANISQFRFHDLRHTFASKLVMKNIDLYTVKELLGHSSIEMTQKYAHLSADHKAKAVASLD